ncbi:MAG: tetratricopeptide repeat protein [candidate division KSB1 bacterium]|nr:tetratricopeptide repeat protein [candidate division KSB1 bacterium]MDZ7367533.1 tetratricopeptide repeat protein [candidate division KSB1 bacterium]MDZ7404909.1 tetratricopeptide repeat protein [candidate division KSB1 bacterium]
MEIYHNRARKRQALTIALAGFFLFAVCRLAFAQNTPATDDFLYAQKLFNDGYYDLSISQLRLFMQRYPDAQQVAEAWRLTGEANFALKKFAAAREAFETFEIRFPAHPAIEPVRLRTAECFAREGALESAALAYRRFVLLHPQSSQAPAAQYRSAELWLRAGDEEKARTELYRLLEDYSGSDYRLPGHLLLVQSFEKSGDTKRALDEAERLLRSFPPNDLTAQAYFIRGRLQEQLGQFQLAETSYQELTARFDDSKKTAGRSRPAQPPSNEWTSQAYARLAELANARGDLNGALSFLDKAEPLAPNAHAKNRLVLRRAEMQAEMNDDSRALEALTKFDRADTDSVHKLIYLHTVGLLQENLRNDAAAVEAYRQATRLPRAVESRSDSATTNPQYRRQRSFWRGAAVLAHSQKYHEALALCRAYRSEYPGGEFGDAVLLLEADIQRDGFNDYPAALRLYQELLEKFPQSSLVDDAQRAVADTYEKIGERRLAISEWQRLLRFYPASEHYASAQARLRLLEEFAPSDTPESMAKLTQLILQQSRRSTLAPNALAVQLAKLHLERREFQQAVTYCKQALQERDDSRTWHEAMLLLGTCYFKLGQREYLQVAGGKWQNVWLDSAKISLNFLATRLDSSETKDLAKRAGLLLAQIMFPPPKIFGAAEALPRTPQTLARADSILSLFGENSELDYLRLWRAQTRKKLQAQNLATPSPARKLLLAEVDSLENTRIVQALQKVAGVDQSPWKNLAQLELADWHWQRGDSANAVRAMAQLQNSSLKDPHVAIGQLLLAKWLMQRRNHDLALDQLATIQKKYFYSALADSAARLRVRLLMQANRYSEALREMEQGARGKGQIGSRSSFTNGASTSDGLDLTRARAAEAIAAYPVAIRSYLKFLHNHPQAPEAAAVLLHVARLTKQIGAAQLATSYFEECLQRFPDAPEAREAKLELAEMHYDAEDYARARELFLDLVREAPAGEKAPPMPWELRARKGAILCLYKTNQAGVAENEIKFFRTRFPNDKNSLAEMQYAAGELAVAQKNFPEAEKIFKKLSNDYRNTPAAIYGDYGLGKALIMQNKFQPALEVLTEIPRRYPNHPFLPTFYIGLGDFYQSQQQWDNALTAFNKVVQDSAFDSNYRLATRYLINVYDRLGLYDRAIGLCRHYVARFPDDAMTFNLRIKIGVFLMNLSQFDDAIAHFRKLKPLADAETEPEIQYYIGKSYFNAGQFEQAIAELLRVKFFSKPTKLPWDITALYESGLCYMRLKNYDRARQLFQQIVREQGSQSDFGRFAQAKIDELEAMKK